MTEEHLQAKCTRRSSRCRRTSTTARDRRQDAGRIAGLSPAHHQRAHRRSLAYRLNEEAEKKIVVYDLGGGTFDVSILQLGQGVFEVKATSGDTFLGGEDFDSGSWSASSGSSRRRRDLAARGSPGAAAPQEASEKAKCELSSETRSEINLPFISADAKGPKHLNVVLARDKFDELTADLVDRTRKPCLEAMSLAGLKPAEIDECSWWGHDARPQGIQMVREISARNRAATKPRGGGRRRRGHPGRHPAGTRVMPPTRSTSSISAGLSPASDMASRHGLRVRSTRSAVSSSNLSRARTRSGAWVPWHRPR